MKAVPCTGPCIFNPLRCRRPGAGNTPGNLAKPLARAPAPPRPRDQPTSRRLSQVAAPCLAANPSQARLRSCRAMETQEQPAVAVGLLSAPTDTADAAAAGPSSSAPPPPLPPPLAAAECKPEGEGDMLSQDDTNLLFLLANIANGDDNAEQGGARARRGALASSSGGSSDTQSQVVSMDGEEQAGGRRQRHAAAQQRLALRQRAALEAAEEDEEMGADTDSDEPLSGDDDLDGASRPRALAAAGFAAAAADAAEGGDGEAPRPAKRSKPAKPLAELGPRKYVSSQITIPILEAEGCFNMTQVDAARHLGFGSSTVLKKVMRRLGIKQWPYRKRTSAKKITHSLEEYMRKYGDPAKVEAVLERVRMELAVYEASPTGSIPLRPELAALRQRLYKLDNKVKHEFKRDAEAPLRQCVQSLVDKTWQELQPTWMANLAQQAPAAPQLNLNVGNMPLPPMPLPSLDASGAANASSGGGVSDATLMLAMLLAQGVPSGFMLPSMAPPPLDAAAATAAQASLTTAQQPELSPEEAEAAAKARVAALAPDLPPSLVAPITVSTPVSAPAIAPATAAAPAAIAPALDLPALDLEMPAGMAE
ncbi:hypothetical protein D9Q98_000148 [Chlorella vulgaris]|uniref:RWP-RK domain-containing protein n=1 Tax=Chlorella vulgaris TaxID=3077 RepID=A0A9D4TYA3_CHLVU|nr:hypothetical protein D9Q98_000148 [Chlorella vulgaris]